MNTSLKNVANNTLNTSSPQSVAEKTKDPALLNFSLCYYLHQLITSCGISVGFCIDVDNSVVEDRGVYVVYGIDEKQVNDLLATQKEYDNPSTRDSKNCSKIIKLYHEQSGMDAFLHLGKQVFKIEDTSGSLFALMFDVARMEFTKHFMIYVPEGERNEAIRNNHPISKAFINLALDYYEEALDEKKPVNLRLNYYQRTGDAITFAFDPDKDVESFFGENKAKRSSSGQIKYLDKTPFVSSSKIIVKDRQDLFTSDNTVLNSVSIRKDDLYSFISNLEAAGVKRIYLNPDVLVKADFGTYVGGHKDGSVLKTSSDSFAYQIIEFPSMYANLVYGLFQMMYYPVLSKHIGRFSVYENPVVGTKLPSAYAKFIIEALEDFNQNHITKIDWYFDLKGMYGYPADIHSIGLFVEKKDSDIFFTCVLKAIVSCLKRFRFLNLKKEKELLNS